MAERISIKQAADLLGVSSSTVRNWIKLGKITHAVYTNGNWQLDAAEIASLQEAITSGALPYLKSRRNKRAATGYAVPENYLDAKSLNQAAQALMQLAAELSEQGQMLLLLELYLILLKDRSLVHTGDGDRSRTLVGRWLQGRLDLGRYAQLAAEFWQLCSASTEADFHRLAAVQDLKLNAASGRDFLGLVYLSISSLRKRKNAGSYYTPTAVVQKLIAASFRHLNLFKAGKIIDPCCGSGNFLIHLFEFLRNQLAAAGCPEGEAEARAVETLVGWDNDLAAVLLAKMNLALLLQDPELIPKLQIYHGDTLLNCSGRKYDLIIGNPPWGYEFSQRESRRLAQRYRTAQANGRIESFNLFVEWAVNHVGEDGLISYVLPEAFLTARLHTAARELVLRSCRVEAVDHLGMVFSAVNAPAVTLIARKTKVKADLAEPANGIQGFHAYGDRADQDILHMIQSLPNLVYLKGRADFALGIVTGNNSRHLLTEPVPGSEPVISGRDVLPYRIEQCTYHMVYRRDQLQQVAPDRFYRAPEKLVYRFIHRNLIAAYDDQGRLSINSANIVIPWIEGVPIKYILAVLNSRIAQYYRMVTHPSVKVLRSFLELVPIAVPTPAEKNTIVDLADRIIRSKNPAERRKLYEEIDQNLMKYYNLSRKSQTYIRRKCQTVELL